MVFEESQSWYTLLMEVFAAFDTGLWVGSWRTIEQPEVV
jgi:hypothetical protein